MRKNITTHEMRILYLELILLLNAVAKNNNKHKIYFDNIYTKAFLRPI